VLFGNQQPAPCWDQGGRDETDADTDDDTPFRVLFGAELFGTQRLQRYFHTRCVDPDSEEVQPLTQFVVDAVNEDADTDDDTPFGVLFARARTHYEMVKRAVVDVISENAGANP